MNTPSEIDMLVARVHLYAERHPHSTWTLSSRATGNPKAFRNIIRYSATIGTLDLFLKFMREHPLSGTILPLHAARANDLPPRTVLQAAQVADLQSVILLGYDKNGEEYIATSHADRHQTLCLLNRAREMLIDPEMSNGE